MEYSQYAPYMSSALLNYILFAAAVLVIIVLLVIGTFFQLKTFLTQNARQEDFKLLFFHNKGSIVDFIGIVFAVILFVVFLFWSRRVFADIPHAINKDFIVATGVVVSQNAAGREDVGETRGFEIQDLETGEIINLLVFYTPIWQGEVYEVIYLPHSKAGAIVRKIESGEEPQGRMKNEEDILCLYDQTLPEVPAFGSKVGRRLLRKYGDKNVISDSSLPFAKYALKPNEK